MEDNHDFLTGLCVVSFTVALLMLPVIAKTLGWYMDWSDRRDKQKLERQRKERRL